MHNTSRAPGNMHYTSRVSENVSDGVSDVSTRFPEVQEHEEPQHTCSIGVGTCRDRNTHVLEVWEHVGTATRVSEVVGTCREGVKTPTGLYNTCRVSYIMLDGILGDV